MTLADQLERHEGRRTKPYRCSAGKLTIGVGRNLDDKGLSNEEIDFLLACDIRDARRDARKIDGFADLDSARQDVLVNMVFNMGLGRVQGFKNMIAALKAKDFERAAKEMLDSKWARQVGDFPPKPGLPYGGRAYELAGMMRTGMWP